MSTDQRSSPAASERARHASRVRISRLAARKRVHEAAPALFATLKEIAAMTPEQFGGDLELCMIMMRTAAQDAVGAIS